MKSLKLLSKDISLSGNKFVFNNESDSLRQQIENIFHIWRGSWFNNLSIGIEYLEFENERYSEIEIRNSLIASILENDNIRSINFLDVTRVRNKNLLQIEIELQTVEGVLTMSLQL